MLTVFPELLTFSLLAPLILRVFCGLVFFVSGYRRFLRRINAAGAMAMPEHRAALKVPLGVLEIVAGLALIVGVYTQIAAIVGVLLSLAYFALARRGIPTPGGRTAHVALLVISLSLLLTGAGAYAVDWPL